jgi:hypothetical protein
MTSWASLKAERIAERSGKIEPMGENLRWFWSLTNFAYEVWGAIKDTTQ